MGPHFALSIVSTQGLHQFLCLPPLPLHIRRLAALFNHMADIDYTQHGGHASKACNGCRKSKKKCEAGSTAGTCKSCEGKGVGCQVLLVCIRVDRNGPGGLRVG
ncbi:hypothetical protein CALVIDRAFT_18938 [Calocera viscosa TUFC12733]|uniref:Zn(2)-C6 fungal-type domain-containing protein n=1 Tax=Calocera viscosa (strain TUFC12733) TaxID=1330018 RepID=A0A167SED0_CALVF|nr:hypothetical protein CALVIDRAFT_18938 [Calocera viscosa TUFC12733]